ncbi:hypothetical protein EI94DRAFT_1755521 [Lactarius quietus]|nr:hypothetical protein EI94DRAFT_1755521 [Lactarius quietus]
MGACCSSQRSPVTDDIPRQPTQQETVRIAPPPVSLRPVVRDVGAPGGPSSQQSGTKPGREMRQVVHFRDLPDRDRVMSAPAKERYENGEELPSQRVRAKSDNVPSQRVRSKSFFAPSRRPLLPMSEEHSRTTPRRPTMSYPARRPLNSAFHQVVPESFKFRILVVGKRGSGKSSLIKAIFKVDMTAAPERASGKADIDVEFRPQDNRYLIVHECSGLDYQAEDPQDLQTIRDFISRRTEASRSPCERLHAIWICVPASDAIDGRLGDGVKEILGIRHVPVILVFTKFDVVVSQVRLDIPSGDSQHHERARARAHTMYEESCRRIFHKESRDVPAEIVSEQSRFIDLIDNLVVTTDRFITYPRAPSTGTGVQGRKQRVGAVPLAWSAAVRVNHDITIQATIEVGRSRYWRSLWSSLDFADQTLEKCVNVIHDDIVEIWNLNDKTRYLSSQRFKVKMSHLVKDLAGSAIAKSDIYGPTRPGDDHADWVNDLFRGSQDNVRCVMGYIVNLTVILDGIFVTAADDMSQKDVLRVLERHLKSGNREAIHRDIRSFVTEVFAIRFSVPEKDFLFERIIDLIRQFCVPP